MTGDNIIVIHTDELNAPEVGKGLWENRACVYDTMQNKNVPLVSIVVQAYNRLEKTKYCVECILKYTKEVDYELILVDNGSTDQTLEFYKSVDYSKKQILHVTKNIGGAYPYEQVRKIYKGKYLVTIPNDVYVTRNWLSNMLRCVESNPRAGMIVPMCSNTSNLQTPPNFVYKDMEDMQKKAAEFNVSNPSKWQERMRLITLAPLYKRQIFDEVGFFDNGYEHNFGDDDISFRIRRAGYKLILCGDTVVCHDHKYIASSRKEAETFNRALEEDRKSFRKKFHGIDAWDDVNNFEINLLNLIDVSKYNNYQLLNLLGIDVRCGTPILEIKNKIRVAKLDAQICSSVFTTHAKYYEDLLTVAENIYCDRIDFIQDYVSDASMDMIVLGEPINNYHEPIRVLQKLFDLLSSNGLLLFKVKNMDDFRTFLRMAGANIPSDGEMSVQILPEEIQECLELFGARKIKCIREVEDVSKENRDVLSQITSLSEDSEQYQAFLDKFQTKQYLFCVEK